MNGLNPLNEQINFVVCLAGATITRVPRNNNFDGMMCLAVNDENKIVQLFHVYQLLVGFCLIFCFVILRKIAFN